MADGDGDSKWLPQKWFQVLTHLGRPLSSSDRKMPARTVLIPSGLDEEGNFLGMTVWFQNGGGCHLLSNYCMPGTVLGAFLLLSCKSYNNLLSACYYGILQMRKQSLKRSVTPMAHSKWLTRTWMLVCLNPMLPPGATMWPLTGCICLMDMFYLSHSEHCHLVFVGISAASYQLPHAWPTTRDHYPPTWPQ